MDCIFCKIVAGELPSYKVYEDHYVLAFLDIAPVNHGHVLIIPKKHFVNMEDITSSELEKLINAVKRIGEAIKNGLGADGYNINVNDGPIAGQVVPHIHFHIIPRTEGDGLELWPQGEYKDGEAENVLEKITKEIESNL